MKKLLKVLLIVSLILSTPLAANAASTRKDGTLKGATIWVTQNTSAYKNGKVFTTIPKGKKVTAIKEKGSLLLVKFGKNKVYISSTYVLIDVKDYIPSIDIRLDMSKEENYFSMGGQKISNVTNSRFYTEKASAWLRYSVAKKLLSAQKSFQKDGYGIVIYDAYRPYSVTCKIRNGFSSWLRSKSWSFKSYWFGSLGESWFLAQIASAHNYGRAVDISLKKIKSGNLLEMPSKMHTLDKRAAYYTWAYSNSTSAKNARYLKGKMEAFGFTYLKSEWWHFQVNTIPYGNVLDLKI